jgi:hypothetical protein
MAAITPAIFRCVSKWWFRGYVALGRRYDGPLGIAFIPRPGTEAYRLFWESFGCDDEDPKTEPMAGRAE